MTATTSYKSIRIEQSDAIATVTLIGPGKGNAMGPDFWRELPEAFGQLDRDEGVRVVVVKGAGGNFSYGLDLGAMAASLGPVAAGGLAAERMKLLDLIGEMQRSFNAIAACRKPVIAAVSGWCIGGGLDLVAACDVRLASKDAKLSLREVKVAIVADLGSLQRLPRIIGEGNTRELALTGKNIDAARALRIGLVTDVYDDEAALFEGARAMAREIAESSPLVVQGIKQVMNATEGKSTAEGLRTVALWNAAFLASHDLTEAMTAFGMKRPPKYTGT